MRPNLFGFSVNQKGNATIIENNTHMTLEISIVPAKPKRKLATALVVKPFSFIIHEAYRIELPDFCFKFIKNEVFDEGN